MFLRKHTNLILKNYDERISFLEKENKQLKESLEDLIKHKHIFRWELPPEGTILEALAIDNQVIKDYLKIDILWHWENDPNTIPPETPKIKVWEASKKNKSKKNELNKPLK